MAEEEIEEIEDDEQLDKVEVPEPSFIQKYQLYIIIGVLLVVVAIIASVFIGFSGSKSNKSKSSSVNQDIMIKKSDIAPKKEKKKKIKYAQLFSQMDSGDTSKILKELSIRNITFSTQQAGQKFAILVAQDQLDEARNLLAMKGLPSGSAKKGYELLDDAATLGVTEFDKRIRFLRALSGELEKAITELEMIESAKVQIVLPEQRLFTVTQPPVTSSIVIRIVQGMDMTDEIVFSIIQLVSNSVENLQAENVSVIDTSGNLLSDGIFERLAAKRAGILPEENEEEIVEAAISREEAIGTPIIPNYDRIQEWFDIKWNFENQLKEKVERQLLGIMPLGSFKVEVTSDIGPLENGNVVDIKRQTISIVVDGLNEDVFVDRAFKQQVFQTVAGSVGYVRGRDSIQLSIAEFALYTEEEKNALKRKYAKKGVFRLFWLTLLGVGLAGLVFWLYQQVRLRFANSKTEKEIDLREDLTQLEDIEEPVVDLEPKINEIKQLSNDSPELLAKVMETWLGEGASEPEDVVDEAAAQDDTDLTDDLELEEEALVGEDS